uniref:ShKT domain-containing protein n=1 Tax=Romanomermis culicivorax TaxID=13658 RepID=A0A915HZL4_ROMCU
MPPPTMVYMPPVEPIAPVEEKKTQAPETTLAATLPPQHVIDTVAPPIAQNYGVEPTHPDNGHMPPDYGVGPMHSEPVTDDGHLPTNHGVEPTHPQPVVDRGYTPPIYGIFPDTSNTIGEGPHETSMVPHIPETPSPAQEPGQQHFSYEGEVGGPPGSEPQPPEVDTPKPKGPSNYPFPTLLGGNYGSYANGGATTTTTQGPVKPPCPSTLYGNSMTENRGYDAKPLDAQGHKDKMGEKRKPVMVKSFDAKDEVPVPATDQDGKKHRPDSDAECRDSFAMCYLWALDGECETNPFWMKPNCQMSCKSCGIALEDVEKPTPPKKHENCTNKHELCQFWKKAGECKRNEAYMRKYCPLSCDLC